MSDPVEFPDLQTAELLQSSLFSKENIDIAEQSALLSSYQQSSDVTSVADTQRAASSSSVNVQANFDIDMYDPEDDIDDKITTRSSTVDSQRLTLLQSNDAGLVSIEEMSDD